MTEPTLDELEGAALVVRILAEDEAVVGQLRGAEGPRLFDGVAPQGTPRPYVTCRTIGDPSTHHQLGVSAIRNPLVQVDVWAEDAGQRRRLGRAVRARLDGFSGMVGPAKVQVVTIEADQGTEEPRGDGGGAWTFRRRLDASVWYVP